MRVYRLYRFGSFTLDTTDLFLWSDGKSIPLPPKVVETLVALVENANRVLSKEELIQRIWGETVVEEIGLARNISLLRKALGETRDSNRMIETLPKRGYRFNAAVEIVESHSASLTQAKAPPANNRKADLSRWYFPTGIALATAILVGAALAAFVLRPAHEPRVTSFRKLTDDRHQKAGPFCCYPPVTDGALLYYVEDLDGSQRVLTTSLTTGETKPLRGSPEGLYPVALGPDRHSILALGSRALFARSTPLFSLSASDATPTRIGGIYAHDVAVSPDSSRLVWVDQNVLFTSNAKGENIRRLVSVNGSVNFLRWSPDGKTIRFTVWGPDVLSVALWEVSSNGGTPQRLPLREHGNIQFCCGAWMNGGRYFIFQSFPTPASPDSDLWIAREEDLRNRKEVNPIQLTHGPLRLARPTPSRDGRSVYSIAEESHVELVSFDAWSHTMHVFTPSLKAEGLTYSPDGHTIAYCVYPDATLWTADADGGHANRLTNVGFYARFPRWSPDGKRLAFLGGRPNQPWKVFIVPSTGGASRELLPSDGQEGVPSWSPDGRSLYFGRLLDHRASPSSPPQIYKVDVDSGVSRIVPGTHDLWTPRISPDGKTLSAFSSDSRRLVVVNVADGATHTAFETTDLNDAIWSRDGKWLWFDRVAPAHPEILRMNAGTEQVEHVVDLKAVHRAGYVGPWLGLTLDGSPLVLQDNGFSELYEVRLDLP